MTDIAYIEFELTQLAELIAHAHNRLKGGNPMNITGLADRTEAVCSQIAALTPADGQKLESRMLRIVTSLDKLAEDIDNRKQSLNELLTELGADQLADPSNGAGT